MKAGGFFLAFKKSEHFRNEHIQKGTSLMNGYIITSKHKDKAESENLKI